MTVSSLNMQPTYLCIYIWISLDKTNYLLFKYSPAFEKEGFYFSPEEFDLVQIQSACFTLVPNLLV